MADGSEAGSGLHRGSDPGSLVTELRDAGWVLPRGVRRRRELDEVGSRGAEPVAGVRPGRVEWSLVGTVSSPVATPVDGAGLVVGEGWSLDWWIGADDRWRIPAREGSIRQFLLGDAPVVETLMRVPGGEAVHRAYGVRSPRPVGDEWVVAEVENRTAIPFATVVVIRPFVADGVGSVREITIEPVGGGRGRDVAHMVRVDGRPAVVLPRRPARVAVGDRAGGDVVDQVLSGAAGTELLTASCPQGLATMALVFPTPHTAVLRAVVPVGETGTGPLDYPQVLPDAATVASGWEVHRRGPRLEVPDHHLAAALTHARAHVQLAHDGESVRRDGHLSSDMELGATEVILAALDLMDRPSDVGVVVARWVDRLASASVEADALVLSVVSRHWLLHRVDELLDWMLPEVSAAVERLARANKRGQLSDPVLRWRVSTSLGQAANMLDRCGQRAAAAAVGALESKVRHGAVAPTEAGTEADAVDRVLAARGPALDAVVSEAGPLTAWEGPAPGSGTRRIGHDLAASAALITALRHQMVTETDSGLDLLPVHPDNWYGGGVEVHDLPTEWGRISYGVRWHGIRPALLWHLEPHDGVGPVVITASGLDRTWTTTELKGDALLGDVLPPGGLKSLTIVAEHPDIDPVMRRPGSDPGPSTGPTVPEGGSFS